MPCLWNVHISFYIFNRSPKPKCNLLTLGDLISNPHGHIDVVITEPESEYPVSECTPVENRSRVVTGKFCAYQQPPACSLTVDALIDCNSSEAKEDPFMNSYGLFRTVSSTNVVDLDNSLKGYQRPIYRPNGLKRHQWSHHPRLLRTQLLMNKNPR